MLAQLTQAEKMRLITENRGLIPYIAKKYFHHFPFLGFSTDEMYRIGEFGMVEAIEHWRPQLGDFPQYAYSWIRNELHVALRQRTNIIHIPREVARHAKALKRFANAKKANPLDIRPNDLLVQDMLGLNASQIERARRVLIISHSVASLDTANQKTDGDRSIDDVLPSTQTLWRDSDDHDDPEHLYLKKQLRSLFFGVLTNGHATLTDREQVMLRLIFLEDCNMAEVGRIFGCTRSNIEARVKNTLLKIRHLFHEFH